MASEAVKKQIFRAVSDLSLPLDRSLSEEKVTQACCAAKLLRNRILREYSRVEEYIESNRQKELYDDENEETEDVFNTQNADVSSKLRECGRQDFMFVSEMMVMENIVIPLLLAHGMNHNTDLLLQLLKLLTSMLLPVPEHSLEEARQQDYVSRLIKRCGTDEFFTLLIQCVAPIAEKRSSRSLQRHDVVLLEIVLKIITLFFTGTKENTGAAIGAFCRNHGFELFLVILNQNYAKFESRKKVDLEVSKQARSFEYNDGDSEQSDEDIVVVNSKDEVEILELASEVKDVREDLQETESIQPECIEGVSLSKTTIQDNIQYLEVDEKCSEKRSENGEENVGSDEEDQEEEELGEGESESELTDEEDYDSANRFKERMLELLESDEQLWKWNIQIVTAMAAVLRCANSIELAQLSFMSNDEELSSSFNVMGLLRTEKRLRESKKESDRWRVLARSKNGAIASNGLLVRGTSFARREGEGGALGSASLLLPLKSKDPIEKNRDIDLRKKGRFVKGIHDDTIGLCIIPLPTKMQLSQQCFSFICYGFEPLNMMIWDRLTLTINSVEGAVTEYVEHLASLKNLDDDVELPRHLNKSTLTETKNVIDYISMCASLLRYTREIVRLNKEVKKDNSLSFNQQWKCISSIITVHHIRCGLQFLRAFLNSPELRKRFGNTSVITYLAELFMTINHLVDGDIVNDSSVVIAANALASTILYNEENILLVFDVISYSAMRPLSPAKSGNLVLLVYSVLRLMEKGSFRGNVVFPSKKKNRNFVEDDVKEVGGNDLNGVENEVAIDQTEIDDTPDGKGTQGPEASTPLQAVALENVGVQSNVTFDKRAISTENVSCASSGHAGVSSLASEREVNLWNYFKRLATAKNMKLILSSLRHWRVNDSDVNAALSYIIYSIASEGSANVFFSASFLVIMRDILTAGKESTGALYDACDYIVYEFFNPGFAKLLDKRKNISLGESTSVLRGAQSFLGFEVSLRCARSLFSFNSTDYNILEEKGLPHLNDSTVIPLDKADNNDNFSFSPSLVPEDELTSRSFLKRPRNDEQEEQSLEISE